MKRRILCFLLASVMVLSLLPATLFSASAESNLQITDEAVEILKNFEGFSAEAYHDYHQWSIGYGTSCKENEYPDGITEEKADELLRARLAISAAEINKFIDKFSLNINQDQFNALMLFTYNCGEGWMNAAGRFRQSVINGDTGNDFIYNMCLWSIAGTEPSSGLLNRRLCEADMYLNGYYSNYRREEMSYVIFDGQGGTPDDRMQGYISGTNVLVKPVPADRAGYRFMGWYTQAEGGQWVTGLTEAHDGKTLYAHWQQGEGALGSNGDVLGTAVSYTFVAGNGVNLKKYAKPNEASEVKGSMTAGDSVSIVADYVDDCLVKWGKLSSGEWIMLGSAVPSQTVTTQTPVTVTVTNEYINVRRNPGVNSTQVGTVVYGDELTIVRTQKVNNELWGKFSEGWVNLQYTDYNLVLDEQENGSTEVIASGVVVVNQYLNVRKGPGTNYGLAGKLLPGDEVKITRIQKVGTVEWGRIEGGWVSMDYIQLIESDDEPDDSQTPDETPDDPDEAPDDPGETPDDSDKDPDESNGTTDDVLYTGTVVNTTSLRVRSAPGIKNPHIGNLTGGQKVSILEERKVDNSMWGRISSGWISLNYVQADPTAEDMENAVCGVVISFSNLNVRSAPGAHNALRGTIAPGTVINIYQQQMLNNVAWGRTDKGWVCMTYVQLDETLEPSDPDLPELPEEDEDTDVSEKPDGSPLYTGTVFGTYALRVRTGPGTNYAEVTRLTYGVKLNIYEIKQVNKMLWGRIDNGWVCLVYAELDPTPENLTQPLKATVETYTPLNIRKGPAVSFAQVGLLTNGDQVTIFEIDDSGKMPWGRIDKGWICLDYVHIAVPVPGSVPEEDPNAPGDTDPNETEAPDETEKPDETEAPKETELPTVTVRYTGKVILTNSLRIRKGAGTNYAEVGRLALGAKVTLLEVADVNGIKWGRIDKGWICLSYVQLDATAENASYTLGGKVTVYNTKLKIRSGAGVNNAIVGELANGSKITIYEITKVGTVAWGRMDQGWVCLDYVTLQVPDEPATPDIPGDTEPDETEDPGDTEPDETEPDETLPNDEPIGPDDVVMFTGKAYNTALKVYASASTSSKQVGTVNSGAKVELYRVVKVDNVIWGRTEKGWVKTANIRLDATKENVVYTMAGTVTVGNTPLNVRAGAGVGYKQVTTLTNGTKVSVYNITMVNNVAWGRIDQGWVSLDYVILQVPDPAKFSDEPQLPVGSEKPPVDDSDDDEPEIPDDDLTDPEDPKADVRNLVIVVTADTISQITREQYPKLESVNFLNSTCYDAIEEFIAQNPDIEVTYKVSVGGTYIANTATTASLLEGKFELETLEGNLKYLPKLTSIHLRKTTMTLAQINAFAGRHNKLDVTYSVAIGDQEVRSDAQQVELQSTNVTYAQLAEKLPLLPEIFKLKLCNTELTLKEISDFAKAFPDVELTYSVYIYGQEVDSTATKVNLANLIATQVEGAAAKLGMLPALEEVDLVNEKGLSNLKPADVKKLMELVPDVEYNYSFDFYGVKIDINDEKVVVEGRYIGDDGEQNVRAVLSIMRNCTYFLLDDCGISDAIMADIRDDFRGTTKVVWRVYFASHKDQPNYPRNALSDATVIRSCYGLNDTNCDNLKYFEDVEYIDFGHNTTLTRLDYIEYMPKLKYIILSGSAITSLEPFANHEQLEFLEAAWCSQLTDISALETCPNLKYLNISYTSPKDITVLYDLPLELLHCVGGTVTNAQVQTLKSELPDCLITYTGTDHIGTGWRFVNGKQHAHETLRQEVFAEFLDGK